MALLFENGTLAKTFPLTALAIRSPLVTLAHVARVATMGPSEDLFRVDGRAPLSIAPSAVFGGSIGPLIYFHALKAGDASVVIPITAGYPLATVLFAVLFLGEPITSPRFLGVILIVAGLYFVR